MSDAVAELNIINRHLNGEETATGLEGIDFGAARIRVDDKKIINCREKAWELHVLLMYFCTLCVV